MPTPAPGAALDDFNTGASQLLDNRTGWSNGARQITGDLSLQTDATPTVANNLNTPATQHSNFWATQFAADQQVWVKMGGTVGDQIEIVLRGTSAASTGPGNYYSYIMRYNGVGNHIMYNGGSLTTGNVTPPAVGDVLLLQAIGSLIEMWTKPVSTGAWALLDSVTNTSLNAAGYIGVILNATNINTIDSFGGGAALLAGVGGGSQFPRHIGPNARTGQFT